MKTGTTLSLLLLALIALGGCRIGGGFDAGGRVAAPLQSTGGESTAPRNGTEAVSETVPVIYLALAG
ncbi:MAG: hypothetical protein OEY28_08665 [Nitrospira sp.]|nr:hypothetical protein [Nitrospira sp.]